MAAPRIFSLSFRHNDKLLLVNAPKNLRRILSTAAREKYSLGVQNAELIGQDVELKLTGRPWQIPTTEQEIAGRKFLMEIIKRFDAENYKLMTATNLNGTSDSLFFKHMSNSAATHYMMLYFSVNNRIRLLGCPPNVVKVVRACITKFWPEGIEKEMLNFDCLEFKLSGNPWNVTLNNAINIRMLVLQIMYNLMAKGWVVQTTLETAGTERTIFLFRSCHPACHPHFCLSPFRTNKIRFINASKDLISTAAHVIRTNWPLGVQKEGPKEGAYELKLNGQPWVGRDDSVVSKRLMGLLLHKFSLLGWQVICSADVSPVDPSDAHSWFLAHTDIGIATQQTESQPMAFQTPTASPAHPMGFHMPTAPPAQAAPSGADYEAPPPSYLPAEAAPSGADYEAPSHYSYPPAQAAPSGADYETPPPSYEEVLRSDKMFGGII